MPGITDGAVRERRADKTEKSDSEQALKLLDGEPEVSYALSFRYGMVWYGIVVFNVPLDTV